MKINNRNVKRYKWCWVAREMGGNGGWRLELCVGNETYRLTGTRFGSIEEIEEITNRKDGKVVYIHLKNTKYPINE